MEERKNKNKGGKMIGLKKGFTAIEAVIAVVIIAIIGGIVWYTLGNKAGADVSSVPANAVKVTQVSPYTVKRGYYLKIIGKGFSNNNNNLVYIKDSMGFWRHDPTQTNKSGTITSIVVSNGSGGGYFLNSQPPLANYYNDIYSQQGIQKELKPGKYNLTVLNYENLDRDGYAPESNSVNVIVK